VRGAAATLALLAAISGCRGPPSPTPPAPPPPSGALDSARLARAAAEPGQWFLTGRDGSGAYYSPLAQIDASNVARLGLAWEYRFGTYRGMEATPVVIDGVLYVTGNWGVTYAFDAGTGRRLWRYDPEIDYQWARYVCCDAVNRGVAVWRGRVYVGALDGYLHAIDATTGTRIWKVDTVPARGPKTPYTMTGVPVIAGDSVVVGSSGGDFAGVRGYVAAFDLETGKFRWRFYTVPRDPAEGPQDQPHLVAALATWDPKHPWSQGIGGTVWDGMSYDPELKLLYVGTGNSAPYNLRADGRHGGDDLYTAAIVAIHADSGTLAWYYQTTPGDRWDFDSAQKFVFARLEFAGRPRQILLQASKNGFLYALDRATGELLAAHQFAAVNWTRGIDAKTGRPMSSTDADYEQAPKLIMPSAVGAHSWQPMALSPKTGLLYIPVREEPMVYVDSTARRAGLVEGWFTTPAFAPEDYDPKELHSLFGNLPPLKSLAKGHDLPPPAGGALRALDPASGRTAWQIPTASAWDGGVLATGGNLVFQGDMSGHLNAYAADSGKRVASIDLGTSVMAAPMSYAVGGTQYVAVLAGLGGGMLGADFEESSAAYRYGNEGRLIVLRLEGGPVPLPSPYQEQPMPAPPPDRASATQIAQGELLYNRYCARCHGFGRGVIADLRRMSPEDHQLFDQIVRGGAYLPRGMGRFDDVLSVEDASAIHGYVIHRAWAEWREHNQ
jgi:quinohemoprotein ethanol dehydrogenase